MEQEISSLLAGDMSQFDDAALLEELEQLGSSSQTSSQTLSQNTQIAKTIIDLPQVPNTVIMPIAPVHDITVETNEIEEEGRVMMTST